MVDMTPKIIHDAFDYMGGHRPPLQSKSGGTVGIDGQGRFSAFHKISKDGRRNRGQEDAIPIMSGGVVNAGYGAGAENRKSIRSCRTKACPRFQNRIIADMRGDL